MSWQGCLFIGEPAPTLKDAKAIWKRLGVTTKTLDDVLGAEKKLPLPGVEFESGEGKACWRVDPKSETRFEASVSCHQSSDDASGSEAFQPGGVIGIQIAGWYENETLIGKTAGIDAGVPFLIDLAEVQTLLAEVQKTWPEARLFLLNTHY